MSNQINVVTNSTLKSTPDISILTAMQHPVVMATKLTVDGSGAKRAGKDILVINGMTGLDAGGVLQLQDDLIDLRKYKNGGPGMYRFEVTDQGTTTKEVWQVRLGAPSEDTPNSGYINRPGGVGVSPPPVQRGPAVVPPSPAVPISSDIENLGNGFLFHPKYRMLTVPDGRVFRWDPSQTLPDLSLPGLTPAPAPAPSTPFYMPQGSLAGPPPELIELRTRNEALAGELSKMREEARDRQRDAELAALRDSHDKQVGTLALKLDALVEKLAQPSKEDSRVLDLERRLAERDRESALRSEFSSKIDQIAGLVRDSQANRGPDPIMMTVIDFLKAQLTAMQSSALTPEKALAMQRELAATLKDSTSSPLNEKMVTLMGSVFDMIMRFREAEAHLSGGGGIDWMNIIQTAVDKAGTAVQALTQAQSRKAIAETARANAEAVRAKRDIVVTEAQRARAPAPPATPAPLVGEAARDALAARMYPPPKPANAIQAADEPAVDGPAADGPAATPPAPPAAAPVATPAARKQRVRRNALVNAPIERVREAFKDKSDPEFFGAFMESVEALREALPGDAEAEPLTPDDVAEAVLEAAQHLGEVISTGGGKPPLVADMIVYRRFDYLLERLLPAASEQFRREAVVALHAKVAAAEAAAAE